MHRFFKAFWYISIVIFLANLFYFYAGISEKVSYSGNQGIIGRYSKDELFYSAMGAFVIANVVCFILTRLLEINLKKSAIVNAWIGGVFGFAAAVNFFLSTTLLALLFFERNVYDFFYLVYVGPVFILIWLIAFVISLVKAKINPEIE